MFYSKFSTAMLHVVIPPVGGGRVGVPGGLATAAVDTNTVFAQ